MVLGDILRMVVTCVNFNLLVLFIRGKVNQFFPTKKTPSVPKSGRTTNTLYNGLELFGTWTTQPIRLELGACGGVPRKKIYLVKCDK